MLQALNILENVDLKAMGYNSPRYIHTLYQAMSLAFADRDFYYGDPYFPPEEPMRGLLSKDYAKARARADRLGDATTRTIKPGDPYPFQGGTNPFRDLLAKWTVTAPRAGHAASAAAASSDRVASSRLTTPRSTPRSTPARRRSRRRTRRAGSCRSRRAAAGCRR